VKQKPAKMLQRQTKAVQEGARRYGFAWSPCCCVPQVLSLVLEPENSRKAMKQSYPGGCNTYYVIHGGDGNKRLEDY
jgi:hypothetical protein